MTGWWWWWNEKVKGAWVAAAARIRARNQGGGILKLQEDVQMCGYEDVQVMWEMVRRSELELKQRVEERRQQQRRSFWRLSGRGSQRTSDWPGATEASG